MISFVLMIACIISAVVWVALLLTPARWRMSEQWGIPEESTAQISRWPRLSVIVPARNEAGSLPATLPSWLNQGYPESEIILVDDESSDNTAGCAMNIAKEHNRAILVLKGSPPPPGWSGKLWALEQGVRASSGEWLLFTDADILHKHGLWQKIVAKALTEHREMVSMMALLDTGGAWSRLLIPTFVYFFHFLYPFKRVNDRHSKLSAAAGGCILISRCALDTIGGIASYCDAWIDDIALARRVKDSRMALSLSLTKSVVSIRSYQQLSDIWNMVARTAFAQLKYSWLMLAGTTLGLSILFVAPIIGIYVFITANGTCTLMPPSLIALLAMAVTYLPTLHFYRLGVWRAFTLPFCGALYLAMTVSSAINHATGKSSWRGVRT